MEDMNVTEALLRAILELIKKCETIEELRESVENIIEGTQYENKKNK